MPSERPPDDQTPCPECGAWVYDDADQCPRCGHWILAPGRGAGPSPGWFKTLLAILSLILILLAIAGFLAAAVT